jgi:ElaB/YqjD/DUF883 family membrane-anchored ribosome-binding protein
MTFAEGASPLPPVQVNPNDGIWFSIPDSQKLNKDVQENELLKQEIPELKASNDALARQNDLLKQQLDLQKQLTEIAEKKAEASNLAFQQMKSIADSAIELAKTKPKTSVATVLGGILGGIIAGLIAGFLIAK